MTDISDNRAIFDNGQADNQTEIIADLDYPVERQARPRSLRTFLALLLLVVCCGLGCYWSYNFFFFRPPTPLVEAGPVLSGFEKDMVFLRPKTWIGEPFPLADYIDVGRKLKKEKWTVLIFNHKSPNVNKMLEKCETLSRDLAARNETMKVAIIEVPPFGRGGPLPASPDVPCLIGCLNEAQDWVMGKSFLLVIENGVVTKTGK